MNCPDEETLLRFAQGGGGAEERARCEAHVDRCAACAELMGALADVYDSDSLADDADASRPAAVPTEADDGLGELGPGVRLGRYELLHRIGSGAMGEVYLARDPELGRRIAVKVLRPTAAARLELHRRLQREAIALARLSHPNVIAVHDVGTIGARVFIAMEYVAGSTLTQWLAGAPRSYAEIRRVFLAAGRGLAAAHREGLVHRDFKPDNVLIGDDGRVRVTDFGLARQHDAEGEETVDGEAPSDEPAGFAMLAELTQTGSLLGTPAYMAPEQFRGAAVTAAADQYAFCVAMYEALVGRRPFTARSLPQLIEAINATAAPTVPRRRDLPHPVRQAIARGLSRRPQDRFPSMDALLDVIQAGSSKARWIAAGVANVTAIGAVVWWGGQDADACGQTDPARAWGRASREAVVRAFGRFEDAPYAEQLGQRTLEVLDAYADSIVDAQAGACEAALQRHEYSPETFDLQTVCLSRMQRHLESTALVLAEADRAMLDRVPVLVALLPSVDQCRRVDELRTVTPAPQDPELREQIDGLRDEVSRLEVQVAASRVVDEPTLDALERRIETTGYAPLQAEFHLLVGRLAQDETHDVERAQRAFKQALWFAEASRYDEAAALAATRLAELETFELARFERSEDWVELARAIHRRRDISDGVTAPLARVLTAACLGRAEYDHALAWAQRGLELAESDIGRIRSLTRVAEALEALGKVDMARERYEEALALSQASLGPGHPREAMVLASYGTALGRWMRPEEGLEMVQRAVEILDREMGPTSAQANSARGNLAGLLGQVGQTDASIEMLREVAAGLRAAHGPQHPLAAMAYVNAAETLRGAGRPEEALAECRTAERALAPDADRRYRGYVANCIAGNLLQLSRPEEAVEILRPLATEGPPSAEPAVQMTAEFLYGVALYDTGARAEGRGVVEGTVERMRALQGLPEGELTAAEAWLQEYPLANLNRGLSQRPLAAEGDLPPLHPKRAPIGAY